MPTALSILPQRDEGEPLVNCAFANALVRSARETQSSSRPAADTVVDTSNRAPWQHLQSSHGTPDSQRKHSRTRHRIIVRHRCRHRPRAGRTRARVDTGGPAGGSTASLADELARRHHVRAEVLAADLDRRRTRGVRCPERSSARGLTVDILVNNAGFTTMGAVHKADRDAELAMVRTNVEAVVDLCTLFVAGMVTRHRGAILNTASTAAFQPLPGQAVYGGVQVVRPVLRPGAWASS